MRRVLKLITLIIYPIGLACFLTQIEEAKRKQAEITEFHAKIPVVLNRPPYQPKIVHRQIEQAPFDLGMSDRLRERREYNREYEERKEQQLLQVRRALFSYFMAQFVLISCFFLLFQEQLAKEELEKKIIKEMRKATVFKASPNPFS